LLVDRDHNINKKRFNLTEYDQVSILGLQNSREINLVYCVNLLQTSNFDKM